ncbi:hypothetical protein MMC16_003007 [Acarospora aff. strigata]|nr:hypothetical protein [Acarospora aff. strigata]
MIHEGNSQLAEKASVEACRVGFRGLTFLEGNGFKLTLWGGRRSGEGDSHAADSAKEEDGEKLHVSEGLHFRTVTEMSLFLKGFGARIEAVRSKKSLELVWRSRKKELVYGE